MISCLLAVKAGPSANLFLPQAIGTVLGQTLTDWELLIGVNGQDPHGTFDAAYQWGDPEPRIAAYAMPWLHSQGAAMNALLDHAQGDLIAALDVDDLWHPQKLEKQRPHADQFTIVGTLGRYFGTSDQDIAVPSREIPRRRFVLENPLLHSSVVMRRKHARWVECDDPMVPVDYVRWLDLAVQGGTFYNVPEPLTFIRLHDARWSAHRPDNSQLIAQLRSQYADKIQ